MTPTRIEPVYRIGTVSRLTGIATVTLRMWERRYGVVEPQRNGGQSRLYSREDIARLTLIKRLVDGGHPISTVANLALEQLTERAALNDLVNVDDTPMVQRVAVLGAALPVLLAQAFAPTVDQPTEAVLVGVESDMTRFGDFIVAQKPTVIAVEWPTLHEEQADLVLDWLQQSSAERAVVVYGFGRRSVVQRLQRSGVIVLRAPVESLSLRRAVLGEGALSREPMQFHLPDLAERPPPPRFDLPTLSYLASVVSAVECECPRHLAELVTSLQGFEQYSAECVNRSSADRALHEFLQLTSGRARALMEAALLQVALAENIELPASAIDDALDLGLQPRSAARKA